MNHPSPFCFWGGRIAQGEDCTSPNWTARMWFAVDGLHTHKDQTDG